MLVGSNPIEKPSTLTIAGPSGKPGILVTLQDLPPLTLNDLHVWKAQAHSGIRKKSMVNTHGPVGKHREKKKKKGISYTTWT